MVVPTRLICAQCGEPFAAANAKRRFCSKKCIGRYRFGLATESASLRLWSRIDRRGSNECWPYTGSRNRAGYGYLAIHQRPVLAHRAVYSEICGLIPPGMLVCHACDNPPCCNPAHLFLGTSADNTADMDRKGRRVNTPFHGENHPRAKLTAEQVAEIRGSQESPSELGRRYGVRRGRIWAIRAGLSWKDAAS